MPRTLVSLIVLLLPGLAAAQPPRIGVEFQVNTYTYSQQRYPSVGRADNGDFVVVWMGSGDFGSYGVFGQRFNAAGTRLSVEFLVNTYTSGSQGRPKVAMGAAGDFVVAFQSVQDNDNYGVFARRFNSSGNAIASELQINQYTVSAQRIPRIARGSNGDFVIAWQSLREGGGGYGIFARRVTSAGVPQASEFQVNVTTFFAQKNPSVAMTGAGAFVVAWQSENQDADGYGLFARRYDSSGAAIASEFLVPTQFTGNQEKPAVAIDAEGDFIIAWESPDGSGDGVFARRYTSAGTALGIQFQVILTTVGIQESAAIASESDGDFLVVWNAGNNQDGSVDGVFGRRFSSAGVAVGGEFQANTYFTEDQNGPAIGMTPGGAFVVAWESQFQDGYQYGIFAQRFLGPSATIDVDGNGVIEPLTDILLMLRYEFGFRGATLINGAVGAGCTRCTAPEIEAYIDTLD